MENKIISIDITPTNAEGECVENAGVMWEHNATVLSFNIDTAFVGDYRYYIEYRSLMGTKVRTEYLTLDAETNTITYNIPVTMSSLKGVECYFNVVSIDEDGNTTQVIKPKKFNLIFDYSGDTDNSLAKVNDFSINALLEAIRLGTFKGDKGEKGEKGDTGEKGEKGEKGDSVTVDSEMSDDSENPVQNKVVKAYVDNKKREWELIKTVTLEEAAASVIFDTDENGEAFDLTDFEIKAKIGVTTPSTAKIYVSGRPSGLNSYNAFGTPITPAYLSDTLRGWVCAYINFGGCGIITQSTVTLGGLGVFPNVNATSFANFYVPVSNGNYDSFKGISIAAVTTGINTYDSFVAGSTFELWGVRK